MGAAQSLETLDDMMRCDGCRGSNKDVPDQDIFNLNPSKGPKGPAESKDERLARLVREQFRFTESTDNNAVTCTINCTGPGRTKTPRAFKGTRRAEALDERPSHPEASQKCAAIAKHPGPSPKRCFGSRSKQQYPCSRLVRIICSRRWGRQQAERPAGGQGRWRRQLVKDDHCIGRSSHQVSTDLALVIVK